MLPPSLRLALTNLVVSFSLVVLLGCGESDQSGIDRNVDVAALSAELESADDARVVEALANLWQAEERLKPLLPKLIELLKHKNTEIRRLASYNIYVLGENADAAIEPIKAVIKIERDPNARSQHLNTLSAIAPEASAQ